MEKLYYLRSFDPRSEKGDVEVLWEAVDRREPIADYSRAITRYNMLSKDDREGARVYIDSLFSAEEAQSLQTYLLNAHNLKSWIKEVQLPIDWNSDSSIYYLQRGVPRLIEKHDGFEFPFDIGCEYCYSVAIAMEFCDLLFDRLEAKADMDRSKIREVVAELLDARWTIHGPGTEEDEERERREKEAAKEAFESAKDLKKLITGLISESYPEEGISRHIGKKVYIIPVGTLPIARRNPDLPF